MKISVLVPSDEYRNYAGARIRYGRLSPELGHAGVSLELKDITQFAPATDNNDALLISKCHDARSLLAAACANQRGRPVGVDLFDDYFSQRTDSRLVRFRTWLGQLLPMCDFALCSTGRMADVLKEYRADLPIHVVNDPAPPVNIEAMTSLLASKIADARHGRRIRLAWFGVGDNPHFQVGLTDLAAYGAMLATLRNGGMDVELTVLTNVRALTADGLSMIRRVPVRTSIEEWTEQRERELLGEVFASFLPVNAQAFSAAKSLNRAVTALSAGCQVISAGYPLYAALDTLIYREPTSFVRDLASGPMKHSLEALGRFQSAIDEIASPSVEAANLAEFLAKIEPRRPQDDRPLALVHGQSTSGAAHKMVQALRGLSVASPYCAAQPNFEVLFRGASGRLVMLVSEKAAGLVVPSARKRLQDTRMISDKKFWVIDDDGGRNSSPEPVSPGWEDAPLPFQLATYGWAVEQIRERLEEVFGPCRTILSENSQLPFSARL